MTANCTLALNGNMTYNSKLGSYSYGPPTLPRPDAPLIAGPRSYTYDLNGNAISNGVGQTYSWDGENRLVATTGVGFTGACPRA